MDSLRQPAMVISVATLATLIGSMLYYYKKMNDLGKQISTLETRVARAVTDSDTAKRKNIECLDELHKLDQYTRANIEDLLTRTTEQAETLQRLEYIIDQLVQAITDNLGVTIKTDMPSYGKRKVKVKARPTNVEESEEEEPVKPKKKPTKRVETTEEASDDDDDAESARKNSILAAKQALKKKSK